MDTWQRTFPKPTIRGVKRAVQSIHPRYLNAVEGIALFGSLARGYDWHERSDIDIVVVVKKKQPGLQSESLWGRRLRKALRHYGREVTTLVYTVEGVKEIPSWETLRMATDAIVLVDTHGVRKLFKAVVQAAEAAGLQQRWVKDHWQWYKPRMKWNEIIDFRVK